MTVPQISPQFLMPLKGHPWPDGNHDGIVRAGYFHNGGIDNLRFCCTLNTSVHGIGAEYTPLVFAAITPSCHGRFFLIGLMEEYLPWLSSFVQTVGFQPLCWAAF